MLRICWKVTQTGELLPYGMNGLVFKEGNENTDEQVEYYKYINQYIKENNIPGVSYKNDDDILSVMDNITDMITNMIKERIYIDSGTLVLGEIREDETVSIQMDELPVKPNKKKK